MDFALSAAHARIRETAARVAREVVAARAGSTRGTMSTLSVTPGCLAWRSRVSTAAPRRARWGSLSPSRRSPSTIARPL